MIYKIKFDRDAKKFIERQPKNQRIRLYEAISKLPEGDIKKMKGFKTLYRLRVGTYRIIYKYIENEIIINVIDADNRGDIYKKY